MKILFRTKYPLVGIVCATADSVPSDTYLIFNEISADALIAQGVLKATPDGKTYYFSALTMQQHSERIDQLCALAQETGQSFVTAQQQEIQESAIALEKEIDTVCGDTIEEDIHSSPLNSMRHPSESQQSYVRTPAMDANGNSICGADTVTKAAFENARRALENCRRIVPEPPSPIGPGDTVRVYKNGKPEQHLVSRLDINGQVILGDGSWWLRSQVQLISKAGRGL